MPKIYTIKHEKGNLGLQIKGLWQNFRILKGYTELKNLLDRNAFWAKNRDKKSLRRLLNESSVAISLWDGEKMIGFGRALSDGLYRAVLWDIVIDKKYQNKGYGENILNNLLNSKALEKVEKIYIMTTHCQEFYKKQGFKEVNQNLLLYEHKI